MADGRENGEGPEMVLPPKNGGPGAYKFGARARCQLQPHSSPEEGWRQVAVGGAPGLSVPLLARLERACPWAALGQRWGRTGRLREVFAVLIPVENGFGGNSTGKDLLRHADNHAPGQEAKQPAKAREHESGKWAHPRRVLARNKGNPRRARSRGCSLSHCALHARPPGNDICSTQTQMSDQNCDASFSQSEDSFQAVHTFPGSADGGLQPGHLGVHPPGIRRSIGLGPKWPQCTASTDGAATLQLLSVFSWHTPPRLARRASAAVSPGRRSKDSLQEVRAPTDRRFPLSACRLRKHRQMAERQPMSRDAAANNFQMRVQLAKQEQKDQEVQRVARQHNITAAAARSQIQRQKQQEKEDADTRQKAHQAMMAQAAVRIRRETEERNAEMVQDMANMTFQPVKGVRVELLEMPLLSEGQWRGLVRDWQPSQLLMRAGQPKHGVRQAIMTMVWQRAKFDQSQKTVTDMYVQEQGVKGEQPALEFVLTSRVPGVAFDPNAVAGCVTKLLPDDMERATVESLPFPASYNKNLLANGTFKIFTKGLPITLREILFEKEGKIEALAENGMPVWAVIRMRSMYMVKIRPFRSSKLGNIVHNAHIPIEVFEGALGYQLEQWLQSQDKATHRLAILSVCLQLTTGPLARKALLAVEELGGQDNYRSPPIVVSCGSEPTKKKLEDMLKKGDFVFTLGSKEAHMGIFRMALTSKNDGALGREEAREAILQEIQGKLQSAVAAVSSAQSATSNLLSDEANGKTAMDKLRGILTHDFHPLQGTTESGVKGDMETLIQQFQTVQQEGQGAAAARNPDRDNEMQKLQSFKSKMSLALHQCLIRVQGLLEGVDSRVQIATITWPQDKAPMLNLNPNAQAFAQRQGLPVLATRFIKNKDGKKSNALMVGTFQLQDLQERCGKSWRGEEVPKTLLLTADKGGVEEEIKAHIAYEGQAISAEECIQRDALVRKGIAELLMGAEAIWCSGRVQITEEDETQILDFDPQALGHRSGHKIEQIVPITKEEDSFADVCKLGLLFEGKYGGSITEEAVNEVLLQLLEEEVRSGNATMITGVLKDNAAGFVLMKASYAKEIQGRIEWHNLIPGKSAQEAVRQTLEDTFVMQLTENVGEGLWFADEEMEVEKQLDLTRAKRFWKNCLEHPYTQKDEEAHAFHILARLFREDFFECIPKEKGRLALPKTSLWVDRAKESEDVDPNCTVPGDDWCLSEEQQWDVFKDSIVAGIKQDFVTAWISGRVNAKKPQVVSLDQVEMNWTKRDAATMDKNLITTVITHELTAGGRHIPQILETARQKHRVVAAIDSLKLGWLVVIPGTHLGQLMDMKVLIGSDRVDQFQSELHKGGGVRFGTDCRGRVQQMIEARCVEVIQGILARKAIVLMGTKINSRLALEAAEEAGAGMQLEARDSFLAAGGDHPWLHDAKCWVPIQALLIAQEGNIVACQVETEEGTCVILGDKKASAELESFLQHLEEERGDASEFVKKWAPTNESVEDLLPVFQERIEANASGADMEMGN